MPTSFHPVPSGTREWKFPDGLAPPMPPSLSESGDSISFTTLPESDWWRASPTVHRSTGASYLFPLNDEEKAALDKDAEKELTVSVKLDGKWKVQASVVVTNRWSDWSIRPIPTALDASLPVQFTIKLQDQHLRVFVDGEMMREVNCFAHDITPEEREAVQVGVMGCSPKNPDGTTVKFVDFDIRVAEGTKPE